MKRLLPENSAIVLKKTVLIRFFLIRFQESDEKLLKIVCGTYCQ